MNFYVLLTVHLRIILATDQLNAQILVFLNKFIIFLYTFRAQQFSKRVEEYNKLIKKTRICALSWSVAKIRGK